MAQTLKSFRELSFLDGEGKEEALVEMPENVDRWVAVVMPNKPPIDKIGALALVERHRRLPIKDVQFDPFPDCTREQLNKWRNENILPIDIGPEKYNRSDIFGSAAEAIAVGLHLKLSSAEQRLIYQLNKNNRTGDLKQPHMAIPWILRELYELDEYDDAEILARAIHVVEIRLTEQEGGVQRQPADMATDERMAELLERTKKCSMAPFTPASYARGLWVLGYPVDKILEQANWWIHGLERVKEEQRRMKEYVRSIKWQVGVNQFYCRSGHILRIMETDREQLVKLVSKSIATDVLIVQKTSGHAAIFTNGLSIESMAGYLQELEPGKWFYAHRQGFIINGGRKYTATPSTKLSLMELKDIVLEFPPI